MRDKYILGYDDNGRLVTSWMKHKALPKIKQSYSLIFFEKTWYVPLLDIQIFSQLVLFNYFSEEKYPVTHFYMFFLMGSKLFLLALRLSSRIRNKLVLINIALVWKWKNKIILNFFVVWSYDFQVDQYHIIKWGKVTSHWAHFRLARILSRHSITLDSTRLKHINCRTWFPLLSLLHLGELLHFVYRLKKLWSHLGKKNSQVYGVDGLLHY